MASNNHSNADDINVFLVRIKKIKDFIDDKLLPLEEQQLNLKIAASKWSILQCVEHLNIAFEGYISRLTTVIEQGRKNKQSAPAKMKLTLMGKLMRWAVSPGSKIPVPAPYSFKPKEATYTKAVLENFKNVLNTLSQLIIDAASLDWNVISITSPLSSLVKLSLADTFETLTLHALRHLNQIENIISHPMFEKKQ